jgi:hypothetical protein
MCLGVQSIMGHFSIMHCLPDCPAVSRRVPFSGSTCCVSEVASSWEVWHGSAVDMSEKSAHRCGCCGFVFHSKIMSSSQ